METAWRVVTLIGQSFVKQMSTAGNKRGTPILVVTTDILTLAVVLASGSC